MALIVRETSYEEQCAVINGSPGDFCWVREQDQVLRLFIHLPDGVGWRLLTVEGDAGWTWNGDYDRPTLRPSIAALDASGAQWHGWLTEGELHDEPR